MIEYRPVGSPEEGEAVRHFMIEMGWDKRVQDAQRFATMLAAAKTVVAWDDDRVVGFARALTDGVSNGYLGTVAVAEDHRQKGIGKALVERLMGDDPGVTWVLRAGHGSDAFWEKMGFVRSQAAMERLRR